MRLSEGWTRRLTQEIDALRAIATANKLYHMERYVGQYERFAQAEIEHGQREYFALGNYAAQAMLRDLTPAVRVLLAAHQFPHRLVHIIFKSEKVVKIHLRRVSL